MHATLHALAAGWGRSGHGLGGQLTQHGLELSTAWVQGGAEALVELQPATTKWRA